MVGTGVVAGLVVGWSAFAVAQQPTTSADLCVKQNGQMRLAVEDCGPNEELLTIVGEQGPQGVPGPQGPQGEVGPMGPTGQDGEGVTVDVATVTGYFDENDADYLPELRARVPGGKTGILRLSGERAGLTCRLANAPHIDLSGPPHPNRAPSVQVWFVPSVPEGELSRLEVTCHFPFDTSSPAEIEITRELTLLG